MVKKEEEEDEEEEEYAFVEIWTGLLDRDSTAERIREQRKEKGPKAYLWARHRWDWMPCHQKHTHVSVLCGVWFPSLDGWMEYMSMKGRLDRREKAWTNVHEYPPACESVVVLFVVVCARELKEDEMKKMQ